VRILLDECVDWRLSREIAGHDVKTARQMGWSMLKNGELLALAAKEFDAFITLDRNLAFQLDVGSLPISIVVLRSPTSHLADLKPLMPGLLAALGSLKHGEVRTVSSWGANAKRIAPIRNTLPRAADRPRCVTPPLTLPQGSRASPAREW
jgi:hypothetical protein